MGTARQGHGAAGRATPSSDGLSTVRDRETRDERCEGFPLSSRLPLVHGGPQRPVIPDPRVLRAASRTLGQLTTR